MNYGKSKKNKTKTKILVIATALALVITTVVFLVCFTGDNKGYRTISVVDITGTVSVVKDGIEYSAYPGMILQEGHEIVTAANSYVRLVLDDDKYVKLEAGSRLVFETLGLLGSNKTQMNLERGSLTSEIVKPLESDAQYVVVAPNAVLSVRGTFFRVDLGVAENGEITADVMTYGGQVASQRIMPTGEVIEEEVLIDAGFKTSINMDTDDTVYVMQAVEGAVDTTGDGVANLAPIVVTDIPDDDMVDIYFAAENGHELFVSAEEVKVDIEDRGIDLEAQTSVYELAEAIKEETEETSAITLAGAEVFADDSKPIARVEETEEESEVTGEVSSEKPTTTVVSVLTDGDGLAKEEVHVHTYTKAETLAATCEATGVNTYTCACGENYTEEIPAIGHTSVNGGTASAHVKCDSCGEILNGSTAHLYVQEVTTEPTCTTTGIRTYSCSCGHVYTEEIAALGHSEVAGNASDCHSQCFVCKEILVDGSGHVYSGSVTTAATCTTAGVRTFTCSCGHSYTESIAANGHSATTGGTESCHSKCSVCQATISDGSAHTFTITETDATCTQAGKTTYSCACGYSYTKEGEVLAHTYTSEITTEATCTVAGVKTFTCACGDSYTEEIPATGHSETTGGTENCHSKCSVCQVTITDGSAHTFTTSTTEATCTTAGATTYTCDCGYSYVKETEAMGHTEVNGGTADCHSKCDVCGEVLSSTHTYTDTREEASCTEAGLITHACDCGYVYTEEIEATGHTEVAGATADCHSKCDGCGEVLSSAHTYTDTREEASCTEAGLITHVCDCGYVYTEEIAATGHTEVAGSTETCHSKCGVCQATIEDGSGHEFTSEVTTAATCTTAGVETYSCACGYSYTKEIEATGHTEVAGATADCHSKCDVCGEVLSSAHTYTDTREEASCTEAGLITHACDCGYVYMEEIAATGHIEVNGGTADCHTKCDVCGEVLSSTHTYTDTREEASCTEAGLITHACDCGYVYTEEIAATGHIEVNGGTADCHTKCDVCGEVLGTTHTYTDTREEASCTEAGLITHACDCGYEYTEEIAATGHTEVMVGEADCHSKCEICGEVLATTHTITGNITTEPTCTTTGVQTYSCECGYSYTTEIEALGHVETIGGTETCHSKCDVCHATITDGSGHEFTSEITTVATCTTAGVETYSCACGYSYTKEIAITDHTEVVGGTEDCHSKCDVCDAVISTTHSYGEPEITTAATCTTAGVETYSCACGYSYTEEIEAFGHEGTGEGSTTCKHCGLAMLELNATNFSDTAFLEYVKTNFNTVTTDDEILLDEEVNALTTCTEINVSGTQGSGGVYEDGGISDLTGIEYFTAITTLNCSYNSGLAGIPTSALTNLTTLNITNCTSISSIDLTACSNLTSLTAEGCTSLKTIDASGCLELTFLDADSSGVEIVNVNGCTKITTLSNLQLYPTNSLVELHAQGVPAISGADLGFSDRATLEVIDFSGCMDMTTLNLSNCPALKTVNLSGCTNLATLNLTDSTAITDLNISGTKLTGLDVSGCADLATLTPAMGLTSLDISGCTSLTTLDTTSLTALTTLMADNSGLTLLDVTACTNIAEISVHTCTALTEINASGCTKLTAIQHADCSSLNTVNISGCTAFKAVSINSLTAIETYNANNCTSLTSFKAETGGSTLKTLELTGCTSLTELVLTAATDLTTLKIGQCSALTSLDISMLTKLEVFYANSAGIKTLSGNSTCLDFSNNPNLTEIQVNEFTSFTEINLTANTELEKFVYLNMPMQTVDLSNCVSLWNFQVSGCTNITSLDFSNCPDMIRLYVRNTSTINTINIAGCTKIWDVKFDGSNNISSANLTNAGTAVEDGNSLVFIVSSGSTTATTIQNAEGWNSDIMSIAN